MSQVEVIDIRSNIPFWAKGIIEDLTSENIWIVGGLGSGKSYTGFIKFHDLLSLNEDSRIMWAVAPTHRKVEDILIPTYIDVLERHYGLLPSIHYRIMKGQQWKIIFDFKAPEVHFHSADRPEIMVGTNIAGWIWTEPGICKEIVFEKLVARARCTKAKKIQGIGEGTPEGINHWSDLANPENEGYAKLNKWTWIDERRKFRSLRIATRFNNHVTKEWVEKLERTLEGNPNKRRSYVDGIFCPFNVGGVYTNFHSFRNIIEDSALHPELEILFMWDFNHTPLAWMAVQKQVHYYRNKRFYRYVCVEESDGKSNQLDDAVIEFATKVPPHIFGYTPIKIYGDRSGHSPSHKIRGSDYDQIAGYLKASGFKNVEICAQREVTPVRASADQVNKMFLYEVYVVDKRCKNSINSYNLTAWKPGTTEIEKKDGEMHTHWQEASRSSLWKLTKGWDLSNPLTNPIYGEIKTF